MPESAQLIRTIQHLSQCESLGQVIAVLRDSARALTGADGVTVVLRDGDLCYYADEQAIAPLWKGRRFPMESCISGWCMLHGTQVAIPDIYADARIPHDAYRPTFVKSLAMTPIRSEAPIGAIGAYWADHHSATPDELAVLQALGDSASVAIANVELIESLRQANRRKDEFLTMLAHELRNPLAPIANAAQLLELGAGGPQDVQRLGGTIRRQLEHMRRLVDDLVDVARISRGRVELRRERFDLGELVRRTTDDWGPVFQGAGLTLHVQWAADPLWTEADPERIAQALGNLLDNARKYTPSGGRVTVLVDRDDTTGEAVLTIRDSGRGLDAAVLESIFEPLRQLDVSLDRSDGGLGLGLPIARALAEMHGGSVRAASAGPGEGAEFTLRLPTVDSGRTGGTGRLDVLAPRPEPIRVLVVEDNPDFAETLRIYLEHRGYAVTVAVTGPEGVERARSERPQIVLCDIGLPGLDGYGVAETLRSDPLTRSARLIAVTGYGSPEHRRRSREAGFDLHLVKPVDLRGLAVHLEPAVLS